ncbi:permease [Haloplasma contractile]|uniref:Membrane protein n=1 Tax=Haloplasma contractile SSD-17B TaxID=1033810 RepID=U2FEW9_9MOLU|nr:permease [Haloplasma contractile]ERJ11480.1 Putative membrane protein [Haloplasma contractile SSD-17B]
MKQSKKMIKRYRFFLLTLVVAAIIYFIDQTLGQKVVDTVSFSFKEMLMVIPPIFVLLGLLDVWVPRETMMKYMGEKSGIKGIIIAFTLGSAAAGPLYGAFPIAAVFMKKGVKFTNILIFIGAWSTTKIPLILFEISALGPKFALTRWLIDLPGIIIIAYALARFLKKEDINQLYERAMHLDD